MKSFLKYLLATIVGIIIVHVILFFVFIGLVGAIASFSSPTIEIKDNTILTITEDSDPRQGIGEPISEL